MYENKTNESLEPFTQEDLDAFNKQEKKDFCNTCYAESKCVTLQYHNKLAMFRDGIPANERWGCTSHKTEDEVLAEMEQES